MNSSYLATPRCGCAGAAYYLDLRHVVDVVWSRPAVALRHSEKLTLCHLYTAPPLSRFAGGAPISEVSCQHLWGAPLRTIGSRSVWFPFFFSSTDRGFLGGSSTPAEHIEWVPIRRSRPCMADGGAKQVTARVGLCVEGMSMIMTLPGPLAPPPVRCLNERW